MSTTQTDAGLLLPPIGQPGVAVVSATAVHIDIHQEVMRVLQHDVDPGHTLAALAVSTADGVNLAIAHKRTIDTGRLAGAEWGVELWVGKSGWERTPPAGGIQLLFSK